MKCHTSRLHPTSSIETHKTSLILVWMQTVFPGSLNLSSALTFFTATIRYVGLPNIEPGSYNPTTAAWLYERLDEAADRAPSGSVDRRNLETRRRYIQGSLQVMIRHPSKIFSCIVFLSEPRLLQGWD